MSPRQEPGDSLERAVVDRIVDGTHAVLLTGEDEIEQVVPTAQLPDQAVPGAWLLISRDEDGEIVTVDLDERSTEEAEERIASKLERLRRRGRRLPGGGDR